MLLLHSVQYFPWFVPLFQTDNQQKRFPPKKFTVKSDNKLRSTFVVISDGIEIPKSL